MGPIFDTVSKVVARPRPLHPSIEPPNRNRINRIKREFLEDGKFSTLPIRHSARCRSRFQILVTPIPPWDNGACGRNDFTNFATTSILTYSTYPGHHR
eukprot:9484886-Pyramimonas_sp.AAC.2